jgi:2-amino-4-hydroxy-6-hydroxymethyldihydropteridine diphosphokinase
MEASKQDSDTFVSNDGGESTALSAVVGTTASPTNGKESSVRRRFVYYLGVGSNVGDRFDNIRRAIRLLEEGALVADADSDSDSDSDIDTAHYWNSTSPPPPPSPSVSLRLKVTRTSFLYETPPMYLSEQPHFLNAAIRVEADMEAEASQGAAADSGSFSPLLLLRHIKHVEHMLGRELQNSPFYVRNGPRPIDLDILMGHYHPDEVGDPLNGQVPQRRHQIQHPIVFDTETLTVPHPRISERRFVLVPLEEVAGREYRHPTLGATVGELLRDRVVNENVTANDETRVLPLPRQRFLHLNRTLLMGILNVTPDSFSDGDKYNASVDEAARQALALARDGADIVDVGGESTRPGAAPVGVEDELSRVIPVIQRIRSLGR